GAKAEVDFVSGSSLLGIVQRAQVHREAFVLRIERNIGGKLVDGGLIDHALINAVRAVQDWRAGESGPGLVLDGVVKFVRTNHLHAILLGDAGAAAENGFIEQAFAQTRGNGLALRNLARERGDAE